MPALRAAVFDLDGTLVDTLPDLHQALAALLREEGLVPPGREEVRRMIGDGARLLVLRALARTGRTPGERELQHWVDRYLALYEARGHVDSRPLPGARATLEILKARGIKLGVCTNKPQAPSEALLEAVDLRCLFDAVLGGDRVARRKPDPAHLQALLTQIGVAPGEAVMIGDSRNDLEAARGLGMPVVLLREGYGPDPRWALRPDHWIARLDELPALLARLSDPPL